MKKVGGILRRRAGFTLVELIVVLVILAIVLAIVIPSMTKFIAKARDEALITECRAEVVAAQGVLTELYAKGTLNDTTIAAARPDIEELAGEPGKIVDLVCGTDTVSIEYLAYRAVSGKYVVYEDGAYRVTSELTEAGNAENYLRASLSLLGEAQQAAAASSKLNVWTALRELYAQRYGGTCPPLSGSETAILAAGGKYTPVSLTWKPTLTVNGGMMMIASNGTSSNNAYMIYYNGAYYYHTNGYGTVDAAFITDQGGFDPSSLPLKKGETKDRWVKAT